MWVAGQGCTRSHPVHLVVCVSVCLSSRCLSSLEHLTVSRIPRLPFLLGSVEKELSSYQCANPESLGFDVITKVSGFKWSQDVPDSSLWSCFQPRFHSLEPPDLSALALSH